MNTKYIRKQPDASNDYTNARQLVDKITPGQYEVMTVDNLKAFRKYVHDLGAKTGKSFTTKMQDDNVIKVICLP
jgi:hypothetical protein